MVCILKVRLSPSSLMGESSHDKSLHTEVPSPIPRICSQSDPSSKLVQATLLLKGTPKYSQAQNQIPIPGLHGFGHCLPLILCPRHNSPLVMVWSFSTSLCSFNRIFSAPSLTFIWRTPTCLPSLSWYSTTTMKPPLTKLSWGSSLRFSYSLEPPQSGAYPFYGNCFLACVPTGQHPHWGRALLFSKKGIVLSVWNPPWLPIWLKLEAQVLARTYSPWLGLSQPLFPFLYHPLTPASSKSQRHHSRFHLGVFALRVSTFWNNLPTQMPYGFFLFFL